MKEFVITDCPLEGTLGVFSEIPSEALRGVLYYFTPPLIFLHPPYSPLKGGIVRENTRTDELHYNISLCSQYHFTASFRPSLMAWVGS